MNRFCPKVSSKCIGYECAAFKLLKTLYKCEVCKEIFQAGGHNDKDYDHKRVPFVFKQQFYCKEYKIKLKDKYDIITKRCP